jgi:hypothetical protein
MRQVMKKHFIARSYCILVFALLPVPQLAAQVDPSRPPDEKSQFHLFLLVGQSNMAGRGKVAEEDRTPHPRVLMLDKAGSWVPAVDPLHFDKPKVVGVGIGKTFGIDYAVANPGVTVGLIPSAAGGSPIDSWQPGGYHSQTNSHPYDDALDRSLIALRSGTLKGILWHQGESDSKSELSGAYEKKLHDLVARFRGDLQSPQVPFIAGQMGQFAERPWNDDKKRVDAAHQSLPDKVPSTGFASSEGLAHKGDIIHFDAESYRELGHRFFKSFQAVAGQPTNK